MDKTMKQNLHVLTKLTDGQFVKMVTQLLLSLSVFSFLFSQSSLISIMLSLNSCLSTFPYQLFTHTIDKNFMFLLCNGLLVFLTKYSGLSRSLSLSTQVDESDPKNIVIDVSQSDQLPTMPQNKGLIVLDEEVCVESTIVGFKDNASALEEEVNESEKAILGDKESEQGSEFKGSKYSNEEEEEEEEKALVHVAEDIYEEEKEESIDWSSEFEEEYEEDEEEIGKMNKKFDEFIRRMKEELRVEAQRQLIMV